MSRIITYSEALREAMDIEMAGDDSIILMGLDIGPYGGAFKVTEGLSKKYPNRIFDSSFYYLNHHFQRKQDIQDVGLVLQ